MEKSIIPLVRAARLGDIKSLDSLLERGYPRHNIICETALAYKQYSFYEQARERGCLVSERVGEREGWFVLIKK